MIKTLSATILFAVLSLSFPPSPYPVLLPENAPFAFDPAQCTTPAMFAVVIPVGRTYNGQFDVSCEDGDSVVVTANKITIDAVPSTIVDPGDPKKVARIHTYNWSWTPTALDVGEHYVNVVVTDPDGMQDARTIALYIIIPTPPVITGCR